MNAETVALQLAYKLGEKLPISDYTPIVIEIIKKELEQLPEFQGNPFPKHWGIE